MLCNPCCWYWGGCDPFPDCVTNHTPDTCSKTSIANPHITEPHALMVTASSYLTCTGILAPREQQEPQSAGWAWWQVMIIQRQQGKGPSILRSQHTTVPDDSPWVLDTQWSLSAAAAGPMHWSWSQSSWSRLVCASACRCCMECMELSTIGDQTDYNSNNVPL